MILQAIKHLKLTFPQKYKEGRTVIFTSTSIETACEVSDKIAVLCDGRLRCFGSPIFLNSVFG